MPSVLPVPCLCMYEPNRRSSLLTYARWVHGRTKGTATNSLDLLILSVSFVQATLTDESSVSVLSFCFVFLCRLFVPFGALHHPTILKLYDVKLSTSIQSSLPCFSASPLQVMDPGVMRPFDTVTPTVRTTAVDTVQGSLYPLIPCDLRCFPSPLTLELFFNTYQTNHM